MRKSLAVLCLFAVPALAGPVSTPILSTDQTVIGQPIVSPEHPTVMVSIITFQPGDKTVLHTHHWPHYGYMLDGVLTVTNNQTGKSFEVKPGEFLVEMMDTVHYGENRGSVPARMLIVDQVPHGVTANSTAVTP